MDLPNKLLEDARKKWKRDGFRSISAVVTHLFERYLASEDSSPKANASVGNPYAEPNPNAHALLQRILTEETPRTIEGIIINLERFVTALDAEAKQNKKRQPVAGQRRVAANE